jgi:hypothetical protein
MAKEPWCIGKLEAAQALIKFGNLQGVNHLDMEWFW